MKALILIGWLIPMLAFLVPASAGIDSYRCSIDQVIGNFPEESMKFWKRAAKSEDVVVDRKTGRIFHSVFGTDGTTSKVLDPGNEAWSFKALSYSGTLKQAGHVVYLEIDEFDTGLIKSMRVMGNSFVAVGSCK